jgi:uncharacterized membrane protein (Fun14 family)
MNVDSPDGSLPQWAVNALIWIVVAIVGLFTAVIGWFTRKYVVKVDKLEEKHANLATVFATIAEVDSLDEKHATAMASLTKLLDEKIPAMMPRLEFIAFMKQMRDDEERRYEQSRQDRQRQHQEGLDNDAQLRSDIRAVHQRVDAVLSSGP